MPEAQAPTPATFGLPLLSVMVVIAALLGGVVGYVIGSGGKISSALAPPSATPAPLIHLKMGETGTSSTGSSVTLLTFEPGVAPHWPEPEQGFEYSRAIVTFCSGQGVWNFRIREIPYLFNLVDHASQLVKPEVDNRFNYQELASFNVGLIAPGECQTGSIIFKHLTSIPIDTVRFTGHGRFDWDVSGIANGTSPAPPPPSGFGVDDSPGVPAASPGVAQPTYAPPATVPQA